VVDPCITSLEGETMSTDEKSITAGSSQKATRRLRNTVLVVVLGLLVQAVIIGLALPGKAQDEGPLKLTLDAPIKAARNNSFNVSFTVSSAITDTINARFFYNLLPSGMGIVKINTEDVEHAEFCGPISDDDVGGNDSVFCNLVLPQGDTRGVLTVLPQFTGTYTDTAMVTSSIGEAFDERTTDVSDFPAIINLDLPSSVTSNRYFGELQINPTITMTNVALTGTLAADPPSIAAYSFVGANLGDCGVTNDISTTFGCNVPTLPANQPWLIRLEVDSSPGPNSHNFSLTAKDFGSLPFTFTTQVKELDSDGDGISDDADVCPDSDLALTVIIDGCDSGVDNILFEDGCTIADLIEECAQDARNHGGFSSCVSHLANDLKKQGDISDLDEDKLQSCAARSRLP
jgi:hypothetical protein